MTSEKDPLCTCIDVSLCCVACDFIFVYVYIYILMCIYIYLRRFSAPRCLSFPGVGNFGPCGVVFELFNFATRNEEREVEGRGEQRFDKSRLTLVMSLYKT